MADPSEMSETEQTAKTNLDLSEPPREEIERRAYEISCAGDAGSDLENWIRAERELAGGIPSDEPERDASKSASASQTTRKRGPRT